MAYIEERGKNKYRIVISKSINGKRTKVTETITGTKTEAKERAKKLEADILRGVVSADTRKMTVTQFAQKWIDEHVRVRLTKKTADDYIKHLNHRILPVLGHIKMSDLKPLHVIEFYNMLPQAKRLDNRPGNLSQKSISNIHRVLNSMMNDAVKWQVISLNPVSQVEAPKISRKKAEFYEEEDIANLLSALDNVDGDQFKWKVIIYIALFTGMRSGEIMGLEWKDINFDFNTIVVERTSQYIAGSGTNVAETKTVSSDRTISMPETLSVMLKEYRKQQIAHKLKTKEWHESDRLFTQRNGKPMHPYSPSKWWLKFIRENELKYMKFHGLRHTSGTMLYHAGANAETVSGRLGHADANTFFKIYSHAIKSADKESAKLLDEKIKSIK